MPKEAQTKKKTPSLRRLHLKLPLRQPQFHWTFFDKGKFLAGRLVLHITRNEKTDSITIFEYGRFLDGWEPIEFKNPKAGEIYFGFRSEKEYLTSPGDQISLELWVMEDLKGIGAMQTGVLPKGNYKADGAYSGLIDEYQVPEAFKKLPEEKLSEIRKTIEFRAVMENWQTQWSLNITKDEGWLNSSERQRVNQLMKEMEKEDAKNKETRPSNR